MRLVDLSIQAGRALQGPQTKFIHYHPGAEFHEIRDAIPLLENFYFALALFRSKQAPHMIEAKTLLQRSLAFRTPDGLLPLYMHLFPESAHLYHLVDFLPLLYWILTDFGNVLGNDLKSALEALASNIHHRLKMQEGLSYLLELKRAIFDGDWSVLKEGIVLQTPESWADYLVLLRIAENQGVSISPFLQEIVQHWHPGLQCYQGPYLHPKQIGHLPAMTCFDLWMSGENSKKGLLPLHLRAALIYPFTTHIEKQSSIDHPLVLIDPECALPLRIFWKVQDKLHSLVMPKPKSTFHLEQNNDRIRYELAFEEEEEFVPLFFINRDSDHSIKIDGERATFFDLHEEVNIQTAGVEFVIRFSLARGEGLFKGHLLMGNRPGQMAEQTLQAYDFLIGIRKIAQTTPCHLLVELRLR